MEEKFDDLLNEKCSWSYRSQIVCESNNINQTNQNSPYEKRKIIIETEISRNNFDVLQNGTPSETNIAREDTCSFNENRNDNKEIHGSSEDDNKTGKLIKRRYVRKGARMQMQRQTSNKLLQGNLLKYSNTEISTPSSSSVEVLQTRIFDDKDNSSTIAQSDEDSYTNASNKDTTLESEIDRKTNPIIIQAIPYKENEDRAVESVYFPESEAKLIENCTVQEITSGTKRIEQSGEEFLSVVAYTLTPEINTSNDSLNASNVLQLNSKKEKYKDASMDELEEILQLAENVSDSESIKDCPSNEQLIQDFFSGIFDISMYTAKEKRSQHKNLEKTISNVSSMSNGGINKKKRQNAASKKNNLKDSDVCELMNFNETDNILEINVLDDKMPNEKNQNNKDDSNNIEIKSKRNVKRNARRDSNKKMPKKRHTKNINTDKLNNFIKDFHSKLDEKLSFKGKSGSEDLGTTETIQDDGDNSVTLVERRYNAINNNSKHESKGSKIDKKSCTDQKQVLNERKIRSSSRIASQKIREIKQFEKLSDNQDCIGTPISKKLKNIFEEYGLSSISQAPSNTSVNINKKVKKNNNKKETNMVNNFFDEYDIDKELVSDNKKISKKSLATKKTEKNILKKKIVPHSLNNNKQKRQNTLKQNLSLDDLNISINEYVSSENELRTSESKKTKHYTKKVNTGIHNSLVKSNTYNSNQNFLNTRHITTSTPKRKTWDDLENELLADTDVEDVGNTSKTIIVKKKRITHQVNKNKSFTLSNTTMMQTIKKPLKRNYKVQHEAQDMEQKYSGKDNKSKAFYRYEKNIFEKIEPKVRSKNVNVLEKAITAMNTCTEKFLMSQENILENGYLESCSSDEIIKDSSSEDDKEPSIELFPNEIQKINEYEQQNKVIPYYGRSINPWSKIMKNLNLEDTKSTPDCDSKSNRLTDVNDLLMNNLYNSHTKLNNKRKVKSTKPNMGEVDKMKTHNKMPCVINLVDDISDEEIQVLEEKSEELTEQFSKESLNNKHDSLESEYNESNLEQPRPIKGKYKSQTANLLNKRGSSISAKRKNKQDINEEKNKTNLNLKLRNLSPESSDTSDGESEKLECSVNNGNNSSRKKYIKYSKYNQKENLFDVCTELNKMKEGTIGETLVLGEDSEILQNSLQKGYLNDKKYDILEPGCSESNLNQQLTKSKQNHRLKKEKTYKSQIADIVNITECLPEKRKSKLNTNEKNEANTNLKIRELSSDTSDEDFRKPVKSSVNTDKDITQKNKYLKYLRNVVQEKDICDEGNAVKESSDKNAKLIENANKVISERSSKLINQDDIFSLSSDSDISIKERAVTGLFSDIFNEY